MKDKIVEFDADKRNIKKEWERFQAIVNSCKPEEIKKAIFYMETENSTISAYAGVYNADWEMTGRIRCFMQEIELEHYLHDFDPGEDVLNEE